MRIRFDLQLFAGEKTEPATPRRREEARKKGQVARAARWGLLSWSWWASSSWTSWHPF